MNRSEELKALNAGLDERCPDLSDSILKARRRRRRKALILRPLSGMAAVFALFVVMVNFMAPVAHACGKVPFLKELAQAVAFSPSLKAAVENQYVQPVELSLTKNGITVDIEYLIVDRKNVDVFYRIKSDSYEHLDADPEIQNAEGGGHLPCSYSSGSFGVPNGELCKLDIGFTDEDVPDKLKVILKIYDNSPEKQELAVPDKEIDRWETDWGEEEYLECFEFILEFDPLFTEQGKIIPAGQSVELDGQEIIIEELEVYPSQIRVNIGEGEDNTAWLKDLEFYIVDEEGRKFEPAASGTTATGSADKPSMVTYYAESSYFYKAEHLDIVITGARWLDKEQEKIKFNVITGEAEPELPEGISFYSSQRYGKGWTLKFKMTLTGDQVMRQGFNSRYTDMQGREFDINMMSSTYADECEDGQHLSFYEEFPIRELEGDELWLYPIYSRRWQAEEEIKINIK